MLFFVFNPLIDQVGLVAERVPSVQKLSSILVTLISVLEIFFERKLNLALKMGITHIYSLHAICGHCVGLDYMRFLVLTLLFNCSAWSILSCSSQCQILAFFYNVTFFRIMLLINTLFLVIYRTMIQNMIKEGKIVPSEVTIKLLQKAMQEIGNDKFLIDGFPRNEENRAAFEAVVSLLHCLFHY